MPWSVSCVFWIIRVPSSSKFKRESVFMLSSLLFRSQMISGLGLPSALQVKKTVFPEVTSASCGSDVIRGLSQSSSSGVMVATDRPWMRLGYSQVAAACALPDLA